MKNQARWSAIHLVHDYIKNDIHCTKEDAMFYKNYFKQGSYSKWAASEILNELHKRPNDPPLVVIEEFRTKMDKLSCEASTKKASYIFSVAVDTADYIEQLLSKQ